MERWEDSGAGVGLYMPLVPEALGACAGEWVKGRNLTCMLPDEQV